MGWGLGYICLIIRQHTQVCALTWDVSALQVLGTALCLLVSGLQKRGWEGEP